MCIYIVILSSNDFSTSISERRRSHIHIQHYHTRATNPPTPSHHPPLRYKKINTKLHATPAYKPAPPSPIRPLGHSSLVKNNQIPITLKPATFGPRRSVIHCYDGLSSSSNPGVSSSARLCRFFGVPFQGRCVFASGSHSAVYTC
ncbi:uncharacterized protein K452DRAFT_2409 [Aplosporella prunicola CBS 121167]|uniref:Uncharacterized protein n=1 Tax=Aplosporella prunicola CBS 121167 TaxID=1176127 RepID=A0A6A6BT24_9PEZI|nr:uncharacterized protein K452DRAFT_2409 [Aplosporella prunicola CBS 121167]KAF2147140.1 hypothetical protein K452DRAFT_2409 [Aplosporella prunicola CBS 121167]